MAGNEPQPQVILPEDTKAERHEKMRRNLRILGLCVACYYFFSAGMSWWEDSQREKAIEEAASRGVAPAQILADGDSFCKFFNQYLNAMDTALPTANPLNNREGFTAVLSPAIELRGVARADEPGLEYVQWQSRFPNGLEQEGLNSLTAFILALEGTGTEVRPEMILEAMEIRPEEALLNPDHAYRPMSVQSPWYQYELTFTDGPIDELTVKAYPR